MLRASELTHEDIAKLRNPTTLQIETMSVEEVYAAMRALGVGTSPTKIRKGLDQGRYPWGVSIDQRGASYEIYARLFWEWIAERVTVRPVVAMGDEA